VLFVFDTFGESACLATLYSHVLADLSFYQGRKTSDVEDFGAQELRIELVNDQISQDYSFEPCPIINKHPTYRESNTILLMTDS